MRASLFIFFSLLISLTISCRNPTASTKVNTAPQPSPTAQPTRLSASDVLSAFKAAGLPINREIFYTAENDPNKLLGRPYQYSEKASWADTRVEQIPPDALKGGTVEIFSSLEDLEKRREYVDRIIKAAPIYTQYQYVHKNALVRIDKDLTPQQAGEYEKALKGL